MLKSRAVCECDPGHMTMLFGKIANDKSRLSFRKGQTIFSQGGPADSIYLILSGTVKIAVLSNSGKEAVLAMLGPHGFFGEECILPGSVRINSATSLIPSTIMRIERQSVLRAIHDQPELCLEFMNVMLIRKNAAEEDFCDQIFNPSERRLARALLKMSRFQEPQMAPNTPVLALSHETLSEMIGTTRSRVTHFMNKFRKMGLIEYHGDARTTGRMIVRTKLLTDRFLLN